MTKLQHLIFSLALALALGLSTAAAAQQPDRLTDKDVKPLLEQLDNRVGKFREAFAKGAKTSRIDYGRGEENMLQYADDLQISVKRLREGYDGKRSASADVEEVLRRAVYLDRFLQRYPLLTGADRQWNEVQQQLAALGKAWNMEWRAYDAGRRPYRLSDGEIAALLEGIKRSTDQLRKDIDNALKHDKSADHQIRSNLDNSFKDFSSASDRLKGRVDNSKEAPALVDQVLRLGKTIDSFMEKARLDARTQGDWAPVRDSLDKLARAYGVAG